MAYPLGFFSHVEVPINDIIPVGPGPSEEEKTLATTERFDKWVLRVKDTFEASDAEEGDSLLHSCIYKVAQKFFEQDSNVVINKVEEFVKVVMKHHPDAKHIYRQHRKGWSPQRIFLFCHTEPKVMQ